MSVIVRGKNPNKPYTVRFWVDGRQRERSFRTRKEADDFKIKTDHDVRAQIFVDDRAGRQRFADAATAWLDVLAQVKADPDLRIIPVIVLSSSQDQADINRSYELHANAYIVKPRDFDGFTEMIKQVDECYLGLVTPPGPDVAG